MSSRKLTSRLLAEFGVITLGVLVALAIDSAWKVHQDRQDEKLYLEAVLEDLELSISNLELTIEAADRAQTQLDRVRHIASLDVPADSAPGFISAIVSAVGYQATPIISRAAVQDLISTGNLRLIRDREVRRAILRTDAVAQGQVDFVRQAEAEVRSGLEPLVSRYIPPDALRLTGDGRGGVVDSDHATEQSALRQAARLIQADPSLQPELNAEYRRIQRGRRSVERLRRMLEESLSGLRESISGGAS
jgi:hypothetical protein